MVRAFIAIDLSEEIYVRLEEVATQLRNLLAGKQVRWVPTRNIHLTLKFLGDVSENNIDVLKRILETETSGKSPFEISVGKLGVFPNFRRPRIIWVGIEAPPELAEFQYALDNKMDQLGYEQEKREFSPHLTLGRISRNASSGEIQQIGEILKNCQVGFLGAIRIDAVHLYRSDLKPSGAEYRILHSAKFSGYE